MPETKTTVVLKTSDDQTFTVDKKLISASNLIRGILEDLEESEEAIPLPNITGPVMEIVLRYAELHRNDPPSTEPPAKNLEVSPEDAEIMNLESKKVLFDVILAANYLDYAGLLDLANDLKGKSIDEVVRDYDVPKERQFTPEEQRLIEEEIAWAESGGK
ncbi:hypothetical protein HDV03_000214 [Kappamyces sp. JEL0829]|nr:hypothetical protein HDV03_000214 [Kappamyces sp. JEL0829]